jgi:hypothetical protein
MNWYDLTILAMYESIPWIYTHVLNVVMDLWVDVTFQKEGLRE